MKNSGKESKTRSRKPRSDKPLNRALAVIIYAMKCSVIALSFMTILHYNLKEYLAPDYNIHDARGKGGLIRSYDTIVEYGRRIGLASEWKMYSPPWKLLMQVDWYGRDEAGDWTLLDMRNLSKEYRSRRSFAAAWLWDFKLARLYDNYFAYPTREPFKSLRRRYVEYQWEQMEDELGWRPDALRIVAQKSRIPAPLARGDWTPYEARFDEPYYSERFE